MNRRALLASFLAAPVAVRLGRWVKPAPVTLAAYLDSLPVETELAYTDCLLATEQARVMVIGQFVDAATLTSKAPLHA